MDKLDGAFAFDAAREDEGFGESIAAAQAERVLKRSCCSETEKERPALGDVRECNRAGDKAATPRLLEFDDEVDDNHDDGFWGATGRGPGLGAEPTAHERMLNG